MKEAIQVDLFISSPKDCGKEQQYVYEIIDKYNKMQIRPWNTTLRVIGIDQIYPGFGIYPQDIIDKQLPDYDIYIGIWRKKFATPTLSVESGTLEELNNAVVRYKKTRRPWVMCYFLENVDDNIDELREQKFPFTLHKKIVEFLMSIPNVHDSNALRAFLYNAGLDTQLQNHLNFALPSAQFFQLLVATLSEYGTLTDGRNAVNAVLESAKNYVGQQKREECDILIQELAAILNEEGYRSIQSVDTCSSTLRNDNANFEHIKGDLISLGCLFHNFYNSEHFYELFSENLFEYMNKGFQPIGFSSTIQPKEISNVTRKVSITFQITDTENTYLKSLEKRNITIGRLKKSDIVLSNQLISREQGIFICEDNKIFYNDFCGNSQLLKARTSEIIQIGSNRIRLGHGDTILLPSGDKIILKAYCTI